jgi:hypothetical protein
MKASKEIIRIKSVSFAAVQRGAMIQVILSKLFCTTRKTTPSSKQGITRLNFRAVQGHEPNQCYQPVQANQSLNMNQ